MRNPEGKRHRLRFEACTRAGCRTCGGQLLAHGPHWQEAVMVGTVRRWRTLAGGRPCGINAARAAALRAEAERDRLKRQAAQKARAQRVSRRQPRDSGTAPPLPGQGSLAARALRADFAQLGLAWGAEAGDVKKAFRRLSLRHHPDRPGGSHEAMQAVNRAYQRIANWLGISSPGTSPSVVR